MEKYVDKEKNIFIEAAELQIGENVDFGKDIDVRVRGVFKIGNFSRLGSKAEIRGNNISIGEHLFNSGGLRIGGGGRQHPRANFSIGDRCTIHNNFINVCEPVEIGDDVGLSPDVSILTHGYWLSVLEGFPMSFSGVKIGNGVIVGYRSLIMMGVEIAPQCVIGAGSTVTKPLVEKGIYAGVPARFIRTIDPISKEKRIKKIHEMLEAYRDIADYHGISPRIELNYPNICINQFSLNVENFTFEGEEDRETDDFRDYIRKWGIRIYTGRPFVSCF